MRRVLRLRQYPWLPPPSYPGIYSFEAARYGAAAFELCMELEALGIPDLPAAAVGALPDPAAPLPAPAEEVGAPGRALEPAATVLCDDSSIAHSSVSPARPAEGGSHQATVDEAASQELAEELEEVVVLDEAGWESGVDKALTAMYYRNPGPFSAGWYGREHRHLRQGLDVGGAGGEDSGGVDSAQRGLAEG